MALADTLKLPKTASFLSGQNAPKTPKGYVGVPEISPVQQELTEAQAKAEKDVGMADVGLEKAKEAQQIKELESQTAFAEKTAREAKELPEREALKAKRKEISEMAFVPSKETAQDIAGLFSLINVIGMAIGGGGKQGAQRAMYAMNGMLEGHQKGRSDLYKKEKDEFDKNFKVMQEAVKTLEKDYEEALKMYQYDKEAGDMARKLALAKSGSPLFKAMEDRIGMMATLNSIKDLRKSVDTSVTLQNNLQKAADDRALKEERLAIQKEIAELKAQGGSKATQQSFIAQRAVTALQGAASTMESVMKLPAGSNAGFLPNLSTKDGMFNFVRNAAGRKVSANEAKSIETLYSGLSRYLATIEASGTAVGLVGLTQQLEKLQPKAGDTVGDTALKLADIRRISTEAVSAMVNSGLLPKQAGDAAKVQVERMEKAIPFTTNDVVDAMYGGKKTLAESSQGVVDKKKRLEELQRKERGE